jgi:hypothetical protein
VYYEAPIGDDTSIAFASWIETDPSQGDGDRIEATLSAKHAVYRSGSDVVALQAGALFVSDPSEGCSEGGAEARVLGGHSFSEGRAFLNAEGAVRALSGGCGGARAELTLG